MLELEVLAEVKESNAELGSESDWALDENLLLNEDEASDVEDFD